MTDLAVAPDGSFYAAGTFTKFGNTPRSRLIKFNANATLAAGFAVEILPTNALVRCVAVPADGRVLIGGTFTSVAGEPRKGVAQLLPNGALDTSFVPAIASLGLGGVLDVAARADGKVLVAGAGTFYESDDIFGRSRHQLVRLNANGSWDDDFDTYGGATGNPDDYFVKQVLVQPDQRILIAGSFTRFGGATNENLARLLPTGESDPDFNPPIAVSLELLPQLSGQVTVIV